MLGWAASIIKRIRMKLQIETTQKISFGSITKIIMHKYAHLVLPTLKIFQKW